MTTTGEAKAAEILKAHRAAARVAKGRQLSPAFDAECREVERPVGFWQRAGFTFGWRRTNFVKLLLLAGMIWVFVLIAPFLGLLIQALRYLIPGWFILWLFGGPRRRLPRGYYSGGSYRARW